MRKAAEYNTVGTAVMAFTFTVWALFGDGFHGALPARLEDDSQETLHEFSVRPAVVDQSFFESVWPEIDNPGTCGVDRVLFAPPRQRERRVAGYQSVPTAVRIACQGPYGTSITIARAPVKHRSIWISTSQCLRCLVSTTTESRL